MQLPSPPELLLGVEIDLHVEAIAHGAGCIAEQAFGDDEVLGPDVFGRLERTTAVIVDRLQNRLAPPPEAPVMLEEIGFSPPRVEGGQGGWSADRPAAARCARS